MRILSYGAGVDSIAILYLAIAGEIPKPDVAIFADTRAEIESTYRLLERDRRAAEAAGIAFKVVSKGDLGDWKKNGSIHTPLHFKHDERTIARIRERRIKAGKSLAKLPKVGTDGILRRTCTKRFKIEPVRRMAVELGARNEREPVLLDLGIALDEAAARMSDSEVGYLKNSYPLVDAGLTRSSCESWLADKGIESTKSACSMCPLTTIAREKGKLTNADDVDYAVNYDRSIRNAIPDHPPMYVSKTFQPLEDVIEKEPPLSLFDDCAKEAGFC